MRSMEKKIYTDSGIEIYPLYKPEDAGANHAKIRGVSVYTWGPARYVSGKIMDHATIRRF